MELPLDFESSNYFSVPHLRVSEYVELAQQLLALTPDDGTLELDQAAEELKFRASKAESRTTAWADEYDREAEQREVDFESWTDGLTAMVYSSFESWSLYVMPGYSAMIKNNPELQAKQPERIEKAARARSLHRTLFGEDGLDYFRLEYRQRFRTLAAMLRSLAKDDLDANFSDLLTPPLAGGHVVALSSVYEDMVAKHLRERDEARSLARHRVTLRWAIAAYDHQIRGMVDRYSKASCDRGNALVKPLIDACVAQRQRRAAAAAERESESESGSESGSESESESE